MVDWRTRYLKRTGALGMASHFIVLVSRRAPLIGPLLRPQRTRRSPAKAKTMGSQIMSGPAIGEGGISFHLRDRRSKSQPEYLWAGSTTATASGPTAQKPLIRGKAA